MAQTNFEGFQESLVSDIDINKKVSEKLQNEGERCAKESDDWRDALRKNGLDASKATVERVAKREAVLESLVKHYYGIDVDTHDLALFLPEYENGKAKFSSDNRDGLVKKIESYISPFHNIHFSNGVNTLVINELDETLNPVENSYTTYFLKDSEKYTKKEEQQPWNKVPLLEKDKNGKNTGEFLYKNFMNRFNSEFSDYVGSDELNSLSKVWELYIDSLVDLAEGFTTAAIKMGEGLEPTKKDMMYLAQYCSWSYYQETEHSVEDDKYNPTSEPAQDLKILFTLFKRKYEKMPDD